MKVHLISIRAKDYGWFLDSNVVAVTTNGSYVLKSVDRETSANGVQMIIISIPDTGKDYVLEFRQDVYSGSGVYLYLRPRKTEGNIYQLYTGEKINYGSTIMPGPMRPGTTMIDEQMGLNIEVIEMSDDEAELNITFD